MVVVLVLDGVWVSIDYLIMVCIQHVRTGTMGRQLKIISFVPASSKAAITSLSLTHTPLRLDMSWAWPRHGMSEEHVQARETHKV